MASVTGNWSTAAVLALLLLCLSGANAWRGGRKAAEEETETETESLAPVKGGYWPKDAASTLPASRLKSSLFTHILFAFVGLNSTTFELQLPSDAAAPLATFATDVRRDNAGVRTLLSIGGGDANPDTFARMAASSATRGAFIASTIATARRYNLDGLDLDWEFPANASEMADFATLLAEWRRAVDSEAASTNREPLLLTAAVYYASTFILSRDKRSYPADAIATNLDWINVMNYDYHGSWDKSQTGALAALYDPNSNISTDYGIRSWLAAGVPAAKVAMGLPMYGRSWLLRDPSQTYIGASAVAAGPAQKVSNQTGVMIYSEIVEMLQQSSNATEVYDNTTVSAYAYDGNFWVSYDNATSVAVKIDFACEKSLRGYFFWALQQDYLWTLATAASQAWVRQ